MPSVLDKFRTLISANLHAMVDRALEKNSIKVMDEHIRQIEQNLQELEQTAVTIGGTVKTLKRRYDELADQIEKLDRDIDTLLMKGREDLAVAAQADLNSRQKIAEEYRQQWQLQESEYKKLMDARTKLEARLGMIRQQREQLRALLELTIAKRKTTQTVRSLDDVAGMGDEDIRRIADGIMTQLDQAEAEAEMYSSRLYNQVEEAIEQNEVEIQLEARRQRLGINESDS